MSKSFKRKLSGIIAFVMLFTTVFSNVMTVFAGETDYSFKVFLDDVAENKVVPAGYVKNTYDSVYLNKGANGEAEYTIKKTGVKIDGKEYNSYHSGKRQNTIANSPAENVADIVDGKCTIFTAPENGIFVYYVTLDAGKNAVCLHYGADGKYLGTDNGGTIKLAYPTDNKTAIKVEKGHSYVFTTTGTDSYCPIGFWFMQDAPVKLNIIADASNVSMGDYQIEFINDATGLVDAVISDDAVEVTLTNNNSYIVRSQDINKKVTVNGSNKFTVDGSDLNLKIEDTKGVKVSGPITSNNDEKFDISDIESIEFKSTSWKGSDYKFTAADCITGTNYEVSLLPSEYETVIHTKSGNFKTYDRVSVKEGSAITNEIYCEYEYTGSYAEIGTIYDLPTEIAKEHSVFTFNGVKENNTTSVTANTGATISFQVKGKAKITVTGWYSGTWNINGNDDVTADISHNASKPQSNVYVTDGAGTVTVNVTANKSYLYQIKVEQAEATPVKSGIYYLPAEFEDAKTKFKFENIKKNNDTSIVNTATPAKISFDVNGAAKIKVGGWYSGTWDINGQNEVTIVKGENSGVSNCKYTEFTTSGAGTVTVNLNAVATYLYTVEVQYVNSADEPASGTYKWEPTINVPEDYATLTEAVAAIKAMTRPEGEEGRVTINLNKDVEEQVVVDVPYVTLMGNGHTVSWYYFTIGSYYSCDANGYYSERLFRDKYSKNTASGSLWGGVVIVKGDYFKAENVTFKNTCNYEVTDKEVLDGAEDTVLGLRTKGMDVEVYIDKERGNALYTDANYGEYYNCNILSSQDTLGVNGDRNTYQYFKNCVIGGNVDYICGAGTMVFDDCELQWKTYSDVENGKNDGVGYIVAPKAHPYVFRNCTVTADKDLGDAVVKGMFGRTWGANSEAYFINTKTNGLVEGWGEMGSGQGATAKFFEYNSYGVDGTVQYPSGFGKVLDDSAELTKFYTDAVIADVLNGWNPVHYELSKAYDPALVPTYKMSVAYDLTGAKVDGEAVDTVVSGGSFEVKLVAEEGYQLPEVADLTAIDSAVQVTGATADSYTLAADKASATLKVKDVTANVKVKVVATKVEGGDDSGNKPGDDTPTTPETYEYKFGDVNLDGDVNTKDATAIIAEVLRKGADKYITNDADYLKVADVNGDGEITPKDATAIVTDVLKKEADKVLPNTIIKVSKDLKAAYGNK